MLTDKTKEEFRIWLSKPSEFKNFENIPELVKQAYLSKFFRECCGYHINVHPFGDKKSWCYNISDWTNDPDKPFYERLSSLKIKENREYEKFESYSSAFDSAIKKANEIYNTTH